MTQSVQVEKLAQAIRRGNDLWRQDDFEGMLNYYLSIGFLFEDAPPSFQRFYYCNLAIAYRESGELEKSKKGYQKALGIEGEEDGSDIAAINANLGNVLLDLDRADEALIYLSQPEEYHRTHIPIGSDEKKEWAFRLGNALESKARALHALKDGGATKTAKEAVDLLLEYCEDSKATGRAIRTLATCWEANTGEKR